MGRSEQKLSHDLKNPLTPIRLASERVLLKYGKNDFEEVVRQSIQTILSEVNIIEKNK